MNHQNNNSDPASNRSFLKKLFSPDDPWIWFVIGPTLVAVIATLYMVYIAVTHRDSLVVDDYYKEGKNIVLQVDRDIDAIKNHISAAVTIYGVPTNASDAQASISPIHTTQVLVLMKGNYDHHVPLTIYFIHPTIGQYDQSAKLVQDPENPYQYTAILPHRLPYTNSWFVRIDDAKKQWRIEKRWTVSQGDSITLKPMHSSNLAVEKTVASEEASKK